LGEREEGWPRGMELVGHSCENKRRADRPSGRVSLYARLRWYGEVQVVHCPSEPDHDEELPLFTRKDNLNNTKGRCRLPDTSPSLFLELLHSRHALLLHIQGRERHLRGHSAARGPARGQIAHRCSSGLLHRSWWVNFPL
jgi:hypothetical protein